MSATSVAARPRVDGPEAPRRRRRRPWPGWVLALIGLAGLVIAAQIIPLTGIFPRQYFPTAFEIGQALVVQLGRPEFWLATGQTVLAWALGLVIATVAGLVVGIVIGASRWLREATSSTIEFLRPIPSVALIPLAVLLFGTHIQSELLLIVYAAFWQVLVQTLYGVQDVDPVAEDTARAYGFKVWARIRYVVWPTALPYVMTGVRLAAAVALILAVTSELTIGNPGLGSQIALAQSAGDVQTMYAIVVVTGILGILVNLLARFVERRVLAWHPSQRGEIPV